MSALRKGLTVSLPGIDAGSFKISEKKSSPCGPYFHGCCAWTHTIHRIQSRAKCPSHKLWRKPTPAIVERFLHKVLGPTNSLAQILNTLQSSAHCYDRVFEVLVPQFQLCFISSPECSLRSGSKKASPLFLGCFHYPKGFAFGASGGFLTPAALLISCRNRTSLPKFLLHRSPGKRRAHQRLPTADSISPFAM